MYTAEQITKSTSIFYYLLENGELIEEQQKEMYKEFSKITRTAVWMQYTKV